MPVDITAEVNDRPYRRWIEGSGLSLEANTSRTPTGGVYYVFRESEICFSSEDLAEAREVFDRICVTYWEELLTSSEPQRRLDGARGLFWHDRSHVRALEVLATDGNDQDRHRVAQARQRARYAERRAPAP